MALTLAGWCARLEHEPGEVFLPADVTGQSLSEVADKLLKFQTGERHDR